MYGSALGSVIRHRRSNRPTPNERAVSIASGSTSRTPYIVCTSSGQKAPKAARNTSLLRCVPSVRKSNGISDGRRDRAQELDRDAKRARGEVARAEHDPDRDGEHGRDREPERPAADRVAAGRSRTRASARATRARRTVVLIDGRSVSEMSPVREMNSQIPSTAAIESTTRAASPTDPSRSRVRGAWCVSAAAVAEVIAGGPRGARRGPRSRRPSAPAPARGA